MARSSTAPTVDVVDISTVDATDISEIARILELTEQPDSILAQHLAHLRAIHGCRPTRPKRGEEGPAVLDVEELLTAHESCVPDCSSCTLLSDDELLARRPDALPIGTAKSRVKKPRTHDQVLTTLTEPMTVLQLMEEFGRRKESISNAISRANIAPVGRIGLFLAYSPRQVAESLNTPSTR